MPPSLRKEKGEGGDECGKREAERARRRAAGKSREGGHKAAERRAGGEGKRHLVAVVMLRPSLEKKRVREGKSREGGGKACMGGRGTEGGGGVGRAERKSACGRKEEQGGAGKESSEAGRGQAGEREHRHDKRSLGYGAESRGRGKLVERDAHPIQRNAAVVHTPPSHTMSHT
eukprot:232926-Chlamydomonas_euryale.AAC.1